MLGSMSAEPELFQELRSKQKGDPKLKKIREAKMQGRAENFEMCTDDSLRLMGCWRAPNDDELKRRIIKEAYSTPYSVNPGGDKLYKDLKRSGGLLQPLPATAWKFHSISMDFVMGFPRAAGGKNVVWVIVDRRLTKVARFIVMKNTWSMKGLVEGYANEIIRLHGVPKDIISDRDLRFLSHFWTTLQEAFGSKLKLSTTFHATTNGRIERTIHTLEDMLRACLYKRKCRSPTCWSSFRRYRNVPSHVISVESVSVKPNLTFEERPVHILDRQNLALRRKRRHEQAG
ncbi:uncharacterized protein LOC109134861 [Beta vulgaris subsp. vulgaris]|uniref:uncharacterized protein LOC109134861 n=1 Tax=Beta vulgaris subsp. vulgaris TaxID=3555 RepID=UPI000900C0BD|nr:uncharacterized protein LOC109134861 [Beta vulgaris subsp. vulgaris]